MVKIIIAAIIIVVYFLGVFVGGYLKEKKYTDEAYACVVKTNKDNPNLLEGFSIYYSEELYNEEKRVLLGCNTVDEEDYVIDEDTKE